MKDKFCTLVGGALEGVEHPQEILNYTSSVIEPKESSDEISDKISQMLPQMKCIQVTGIIKNTESFKESKHILDNFKTAIGSLSNDAFDQKEPVKNEEKDTRGPLDKATDHLHMVVNFMTKAGIKVPQIYRDFLYAVQPPVNSNEINIEKSQPLFVINGLDENGNVKVVTDTDIEIKKGNKKITLKEEKLRKTLRDSERVDVKMVKDMRDWVANNVRNVGTLEKVSDQEWSKLRNMILDRWNSKTEVKVEVDDDRDDYSISSDDIDDIITELEQEGEECDLERRVRNRVEKEDKVTKIEIPQSVNKNAYEIRLSVLQEALSWVTHIDHSNDVQDVLDTANKFYRFVENKR